MTSADDRALLRRFEPTEAWQRDFRAAGGEIVPSGPFLALLDPHSSNIYLNYAAPTEPLGDQQRIRAGLLALEGIFAARQRQFRMEFNRLLFPKLPPILAELGFIQTEVEPLLGLRAEDFRPTYREDVAVRYLGPKDPDEDLAAFESIVSQVLQEKAWQPTAAALTAVREEMERSGSRTHAVGTLEGRIVGTGYVCSSDGIAELVRVATLPEARRRGVAGTLTSTLIADRFAAGDTIAWLTAFSPEAHALYHKLGFRSLGERLFYQGGENPMTRARA